MLGAIYRPVLSASTTVGNHQISKSSLNIALDRRVDQSIAMIEERENLAIFFKELDNRGVKTGLRLVALVLAGIVDRTAVEYISATIS